MGPDRSRESDVSESIREHDVRSWPDFVVKSGLSVYCVSSLDSHKTTCLCLKERHLLLRHLVLSLVSGPISIMGMRNAHSLSVYA